MSRLLDRILTSCQRFRPSMVHDEAEQVEHEAMVLDQLRQKLGTDLPKGIVAKIRANEGEPVATKDAPLSELDSIPVIAADDVGAYVNALEKGIDITDLVASMAPPFDQFFIEFQRVPNQWGLYAWGCHFKAVSDPAEIAKIHPSDNGYPRWVYKIET